MNHNNIIPNLKSGFFISLIALPLCLGIAIASACPPIAGVITAIIGGIVASLIGGCNLSIKGPAAGLIVIVLGAVTDLGGGDLTLGYRRMLAVAAVAAVLQIIFAIFKLARFGRLMPPSVIHGMLAAIGVIILAKQIHILLGAHPHGKTPFALLAEIPQSIMAVNPELAIIGLISLLVLISLPFFPKSKLKLIPPALLALLVVVPLGLYWHLDINHTYSLFGHDYSVGPEYLVNIPDNILSSLVFPDFSILSSLIAYKYIMMLALVGSIESVLTVIAVDSITKAKSNLNRDLIAIGIGNFCAAMIGGLPMISEVVRSKANIDSGATTRWSNFIHGALLLLFVSLLAPVIKEIPLAALAAMLMVTGFRLVSPKEFFLRLRIGNDQLLLFMTTLLVTLGTDLLIGIITGCALKITLHMIRGAKLKQLFSLDVVVDKTDELTRYIISGPVMFSNFWGLEEKIVHALINGEHVEIDFTKSTLIDHTTLACLHNLKEEQKTATLRFIGLDRLTKSSQHQLSTHRLIPSALAQKLRY